MTSREVCLSGVLVPFPQLPPLASPWSHSQKDSGCQPPNRGVQIKSGQSRRHQTALQPLASRPPQPAAAPNPLRRDPGSQKGRGDGGSKGREGWEPSPESLSWLFVLLGPSILSQGGPALGKWVCSGTKVREDPPANSQASEGAGSMWLELLRLGQGARPLGWEP